MSPLKSLLALLVVLAPPARAAAPPPSPRQVISLDGAWQIAQGSLEEMPAAFPATVPVPGLVDMAQPPFTEVGVASQQRKAFWYRRTFTVAGPKRPVALLKVNKAQFGTKVWLNGKEVGEHLGCFTPGYFDVGEALRYDAENTLVIRVGAFKDAVPATVPTGTDGEKRFWIPGIYDSVSLWLTGSPYVSAVQVAPHIANGTATVQLSLKNMGNAPAKARVHLSVREWKSARPAGSAPAREVTVAPGEEKTVTETVRLARPHLWTPEDPFLYVLRTETGTDSVETRFGMREFRYAPLTIPRGKAAPAPVLPPAGKGAQPAGDTKPAADEAPAGVAVLNGKPYFLRGTNFCFFRFYEDPQRGGLAWDHAWVRKLLTMPREELQWNFARVCIAPFPEFWYDIADETGWMLQDEFPIWGFRQEWSQQELETEFAEWLRERCNHPSVVVWDADNETLEPRTGQLISVTRKLDLSQRPWDDGYSAPNQPGDAVEDHPYRFQNVGFSTAHLESVLERRGGLRAPPVVINEYDWLWLNRDGTPTTLTQKGYDTRLGANATPEQRFEFCAYNTAAMTEYWRARRQAAAVQHFCYLTYSRPAGQTCDNFVDLKGLKLEPHYEKYLRDAFSPLGVMVDDFEAEQAPGAQHTYRVVLTNDLPAVQTGTLALGFTDASEANVAWSVRMSFRVAALAQGVYEMDVTLPQKPGPCRLVAEIRPDGGRPVRSRRDLELLTPEQARKRRDLALGCKTTASSEIMDERGTCPARYATDGKMSTRWSSQFSDPQWLMVDLGKPQQFGRVVLNWEAACGKSYSIQVSDDGQTWKDVYKTDKGAGGREEIRLPATTARYIRLYGTARVGEWGYSLWELQVYEE